MKVYLDLDGVLVDWVQGIRTWYNTSYYPTEWGIPFELFNMTPDRFWSGLNRRRFWSSLPWHKDGPMIYKEVARYRPVILSNCVVSAAYEGKEIWIRNNLDEIHKAKRYVFCPDKVLLAARGSLLIDDSDDNVEAWRSAGGEAILVPRPWNRNRVIDQDAAEYVASQKVWRAL